MSRMLGWNSASPDNVLFCYYPLKLEVAEGCPHRCAYCFVQDLKRDSNQFRDLRVNRSLRDRLQGELDRQSRFMIRRTPFRMSTNTDPFSPLADHAGITTAILDWLERHDHPVLIVTKSDRVAKPKYLRILAKMARRGLCAVSMTYITVDEGVRKRLEPGASSVGARTQAIEALAGSGVPIAVRFQPLIPGLTDSHDHMCRMLRRVRDAGANHVTTEYLKLEKAMWQRMRPIVSFFGLKKLITALYRLRSRRRRGREVRYWRIDEAYKREKLAELASLCQTYSLGFATCKEGLFELHTADDCCGANLPGRVTPTAYEIYKLARQKQEVTWDDVLHLPLDTPYLRNLRKMWHDKILERKIAPLRANNVDGKIVYSLARSASLEGNRHGEGQPS